MLYASVNDTPSVRVDCSSRRRREFSHVRTKYTDRITSSPARSGDKFSAALAEQGCRRRCGPPRRDTKVTVASEVGGARCNWEVLLELPQTAPAPGREWPGSMSLYGRRPQLDVAIKVATLSSMFRRDIQSAQTGSCRRPAAELVMPSILRTPAASVRSVDVPSGRRDRHEVRPGLRRRKKPTANCRRSASQRCECDSCDDREGRPPDRKTRTDDIYLRFMPIEAAVE